MNKPVVLYPYSGIFFSHEKEEVLMHAIAWMNCKNIMLSKGSQRKRSCANRGEHPVSDDEYRLQSGQKQSRGHGHCF